MQAIGLFFAVFFCVIGAVTVILTLTGWLYRSKHLAKVKVVILPGQEEQLEYTMRALRHLHQSGQLNIQSVQHKGLQ